MFVKPLNGHLKKLCQIVILGTSLIFCQKAYGIVLIPGDPKFPGPSDPPKFTDVTYILICNVINGNAKKYTLTISVNSNDSKLAKALKIKDAFDKLKLTETDCSATLDLITGEIIFGKQIVFVGRTAGDDSGQEDKQETGEGTKNPHKPRKITVDTKVKVENISFGFDPDRNESLFSASFTFSNGIIAIL
jgi:hypothetical protein